MMGAPHSLFERPSAAARDTYCGGLPVTLRDDEVLVVVHRLRPDGQLVRSCTLIETTSGTPLAVQLEVVGAGIKAALRDLRENPGTGRETHV